MATNSLQGSSEPVMSRNHRWAAGLALLALFLTGCSSSSGRAGGGGGDRIEVALTGTDYGTYFEGAQFVHFMLGPATVALALPMFDNLPRMRRAVLPIAAGLLALGGNAPWLICAYISVLAVASVISAAAAADPGPLDVVVGAGAVAVKVALLAAALAGRFAPVADALGAANEAIQAELVAVQGHPVDIGGYYVPDAALTDVDGDGTTDAILDTDGDGQADSIAYDTNADGEIDIIEADTDADGLTDIAVADTDGDGTFDTAVDDEGNVEVGDFGSIDGGDAV